MCGLTGFWTPTLSLQGELNYQIQSMADTLIHRGPDDSGIWSDANLGLAFGFRRLAIVDLSPTGHQPMLSSTGRFVIIFNGEIYNYKELRQTLGELGHTFRGTSDTEVILNAIMEWGFVKSLTRLVGMFAIALWDREQSQLFLARDRLGEKPIYYGWQGKTFLFGSELKALRAHADWHGEVDRNALTLLLRHNCIPAPYSIYQNTYKLPQGSWLSLSITQANAGELPKPVAYWSAKQIAEEGQRNPFIGNDSAAIDELERLLKQAVRQQMVADVPLGAFLSGGVDSSLIVALMQAQNAKPVKTFTIGFDLPTYNEAEHAKAVAQHIGTEHTELYVTSNQALEVIPRLPLLYDEPFSDSSQIPTYLVSQLARQHVTVSLSGDGGDELFAGYNRYGWGNSLWQKIGWLPEKGRAIAAKSLMLASPQAWSNFAHRIDFALPSKLKLQNPGDKLHKLAEVLAVSSLEQLYQQLVSHWKQPTDIVLGSREPATILTTQSTWRRIHFL